MIIERQPCDLCYGKQFELVHEQDRKQQPLPTVACCKCGLVSHLRIPSEDELIEYYGVRYRQDYHGEFAPSAYRTVREWQRGSRLADRLSQYLRPHDNVFEIGAGIGCNVKNLELRGYQATGIEPGEGFAAFSRQRLKAQVHQGWLADLPRHATYDMVMLVHVLEHLPSPRTALDHIWSMLKEDGQLYIEVPNLAAPHGAPGRLFHFAHIYNFTPETLAFAGELAGFEVTLLSKTSDKNLRVLMQRGAGGRISIPENGLEISRAAINRHNWLSYHARPSYLMSRATRFYQRAACRFRSEQKLARILSQIEQHELDHNSPSVDRDQTSREIIRHAA